MAENLDTANRKKKDEPAKSQDLIDGNRNRGAIGEPPVVIEVSDVRKSFKSYQDKAASLKERFITPSRSKHEDVTVLKGISFQVHKGEAVGLIGKNGCGKSTTLKLLTKILHPNEGQIRIHGRVSSLIELGAGFHPDMTGRENIYTNASIFGITRKEADRRLEDIIRFSELEEFIDNPVRTYSSGMYMRLAFAVAINVDADVLLIDEILAVGDAAFQKKCFEKLKSIKENGTTIVIVSHSMDQMYKICDRLIWIEDGAIRDQGTPRFIGEEYLAAMEGRRLDRIEYENRLKKEELERQIQAEQERLQKEQEEWLQREAARKQKEEEESRRREETRKQKEEDGRRRREELAEMERRRQEMEKNETAKSLTRFCRPGARRQGTWEVKYDSVKMLNSEGLETTCFQVGETIEIQMEYSGRENVDVNFIIGFTRLDGVFCYGSTIRLDCKRMWKSRKQGMVIFKVKNILIKGKYVLDVRIRAEDESFIDNIYSLIEFESCDDNVTDAGVAVMEHEWFVDGVKVPVNVEERQL